MIRILIHNPGVNLDAIGYSFGPATDKAALLELWTSAFQEPAAAFEGVWDGADPDQRWVAQATDQGQLVASVMVYVLEVCSAGVSPSRVACIANVSTLPAWRKRGISEQLLRLAIDHLSQLTIDFSMLFTGIPDFYARQGFAPFQEMLVPLRPTGGLSIRPSDSVTLADLHKVWAQTSCIPGTLRRTAAWWSHVIDPRLSGKLIWATQDAYLIGEKNESGFTILESAGPADRLALAAVEWAGAPSFSRIPLSGLASPAGRVPGGGMVRGVNRSTAHAIAFVEANPFPALDHF